MNIIKRFLLSSLIRLFDSTLKIEYKQIDKKAWEEWAFRSFTDKGFRSYFAYEDLKILKELSFGKDRDHYMLLVGRRLQLIYMFDEMRRSVELRKTRQEKERIAAQREKKEGNQKKDTRSNNNE